MMEIAETLKIRLLSDDDTNLVFGQTAYQYMSACNYVSQYIFDNGLFYAGAMEIQKQIYHQLRQLFGLKAQMTISVIKTVTAKYNTVDTQLRKKPYHFEADKKHYSCNRDVMWLTKPIAFKRPQFDLVRNRDYSFVHNKKTGGLQLSINTLDKRQVCNYVLPDYMQKFYDGSWKLGTAKLVELNGIWYMHISVTKKTDAIQREDARHVVGIDRGLRFLATVYDDKQKTQFFNGRQIIAKRDKFDAVRAELQAKGTKSAKRVLRRISGRENRWMSDVNHCISKALVRKYGSGTLFVLEDLTGISFEEENLHGNKQSHNMRNWSFYDLETKLTYKAHETGSMVLKVDPSYTSQRCPHCGAIIKENRHHDKHLYVCRQCGFQSNDDRVGAMNIYALGTAWMSGIDSPSWKKAKLIELDQSISVSN